MAGDCLFVINGLGMGNSTRCHAIIEHLVEQGINVHVLTSGNGLQYFSEVKGIASLTPMESFFYSGKQGGVSGWRTLASIRALYGRAVEKKRQLDELLKRLHVDVAVTDSEYITAPLRKRKIPVIGLNNADVVVSEYLKCSSPPLAIRSHFWLVEYTDYLFHRLFCDLVISPSATPGKPRHSRIRRVGLIVRRSVLKGISPESKPAVLPGEMKSMVFLLSGSVFASSISFGDGQFPFHVDVIGRDGASVGNVTFRGRLMDNIAYLQKADALVINGGFSAVSEAMALNKLTFVIPVPGHAEQFVNARILSGMGYGYAVREDEVMEKLNDLCRINRWDGMKAKMSIAGANGAREAADIICDVMSRRCSDRRGIDTGSPVALTEVPV
ncbi:MAG: glycosyltransferase family protein [bacterium]